MHSTSPVSCHCQKLSPWLIVAALLPVLGCSPAPNGAKAGNSEDSRPARTARAFNVVDFPENLKTDDPTVNSFILQAIDACGRMDYDAFRLLWSARVDPISKKEFVRGWKAAEKVTIADLQPRRVPGTTDEIVYVVRALVSFNPDRVPEPERDVVLMLVREADQWRLAPPPAAEARAMKKKPLATTNALPDVPAS